MEKSKLKKYCLDIRFWLLLAFLLRMYGISNPPVDAGDNWREADVLAVARNFLEVDANIFYPRIDFAGEKSGITGMEFPLLNYLIYLFSLLAGYGDWYGRLINLCLSTLGAFFFHRIIREFVSEKLALPAALLFIFSLYFSFSRKTLPDITSTSLTLIGIYYALAYFYGEKRNKAFAELKEGASQESPCSKKQTLYLGVYVLCVAMGSLSKISASLMCVVLILPVLDRSQSLSKKVCFIAASIFLLLPTFFWYFYWVPYLNVHYDFPYFFMGEEFSQAVREILYTSLGDMTETFYKELLGYSGFVLYLWGVFSVFRYKVRRLFWLWILSGGAALFFMFKIGVRIHHDYYMLWWLPSMCLFAAYGFSKISRPRLALLFLVLICLENVAARQHQFRISKSEEPLLELESILDRVSKPKDKIVLNSGSNPQGMYFAHRRGWLASNAELKNPNFRRMLKSKGCQYILITKKLWKRDLKLNLTHVFEDENFRIYKL